MIQMALLCLLPGLYLGLIALVWATVCRAIEYDGKPLARWPLLGLRAILGYSAGCVAFVAAVVTRAVF